MNDYSKIFVLIMYWPLCAIAEPIIGPGQPDDPNACILEITYHSPFQDYKRQGPIKLQSWPKANQSVASQPMSHEQHMNMKMDNAITPDVKQNTSHSTHQMKGSK